MRSRCEFRGYGSDGERTVVPVAGAFVVVSSEALIWRRTAVMPVNGLTICRRNVSSGCVGSMLRSESWNAAENPSASTCVTAAVFHAPYG